jgi:hypothetical protein
MNELPWSRAAEDSVAWAALAPVRAVWTRGERIVADLTTPAAASDVDRHAAAIIRESAIARWLARIVVLVIAAWRDSMARGIWEAVSGDAAGRGRNGASRIVLVSACATALALGQAATHRNPFGWILPSCGLVIALVVTLAARD